MTSLTSSKRLTCRYFNLENFFIKSSGCVINFTAELIKILGILFQLVTAGFYRLNKLEELKCQMEQLEYRNLKEQVSKGYSIIFHFRHAFSNSVDWGDTIMENGHFYEWKTLQNHAVFSILKFVYSEKATKFCEISTLLLSTVHTVQN